VTDLLDRAVALLLAGPSNALSVAVVGLRKHVVELALFLRVYTATQLLRVGMAVALILAAARTGGNESGTTGMAISSVMSPSRNVVARR
jgi:hypothetical protein